MKRILLLLTSFLMSFVALADVVTQSQAEQYAKAFFSKTAVSKIKTLGGPSVTSVKTATETQPGYYIYNRQGGGFVVIAADDAVTPILGYSDKNSIPTDEPMPEHVASFFKELERAVVYARENSIPQSSAVKAQWDGLSEGTAVSATVIKELETAQWGQGYPYNSKTPEYTNNKHSVTGCVQTAIAIVMRYHCHPDKGSGDVPSYTSAGDYKGTVAGVTLGYEYHLEDMPLTYPGIGWTTQVKENIATLMIHLGTIMEADYGSSTGAFDEFAAGRLHQYMGYDAGAHFMSANGYSTADWVKVLENEIDNVGPIVYSGYDPDAGGHCFVVDGYNSANQLHVNFGWSGSGNGYYTFPDFGKSKTEYNFCDGHGATLGLKPDAGGTASEYVVISYGDGSYILKSSTSTYKKGTYFTVTLGQVNVSSPGKVTSSWAIAHCNAQGQVVEIISPSYTKLIGFSPTYYYSSGNLALICKINSDINEGDYLACVYKSDYNTDWTPAIYPSDASSGKIDIYTYPSVKSSTSIKYIKSTKTLSLTSLDAFSYELKAKSGGSVVKSGKGSAEIGLSDVASGTYTFTVSRGTDSVSFEIVL